jgi:hypothetical protein
MHAFCCCSQNVLAKYTKNNQYVAPSLAPFRLPADTPDIKAAREVERAHMRKWVSDANARWLKLHPAGHDQSGL